MRRDADIGAREPTCSLAAGHKQPGEAVNIVDEPALTGERFGATESAVSKKTGNNVSAIPVCSAEATMRSAISAIEA